MLWPAAAESLGVTVMVTKAEEVTVTVDESQLLVDAPVNASTVLDSDREEAIATEDVYVGRSDELVAGRGTTVTVE